MVCFSNRLFRTGEARLTFKNFNARVCWGVMDKTSSTHLSKRKSGSWVIGYPVRIAGYHRIVGSQEEGSSVLLI